jgi:hypothetical protein
MRLSRSALLTIDVQSDFYDADAPALIDGTRERLPEMQKVVHVSPVRMSEGLDEVRGIGAVVIASSDVLNRLDQSSV